LRAILRSLLPTRQEPWLLDVSSVFGDPCQFYVDRSSAAGIIPEKPDCRQTWAIYKASAQRAFDALPVAIGWRYPEEYYGAQPLWR